MHSFYSSRYAVAHVGGSDFAPKLFGTVRFYQKRNYVLVVADVSNLPDNRTGFYGFHIHEGNACGGENFSDTGAHYNPKGAPHPIHAGDLPPLMLCNGGAAFAVKSDRFRVEDIIGRTVVIHDMPDDFKSQPAGNAGTKIGCGVIERG